MSNQHHFRWKSSYLNFVHWQVCDEEGCYEIIERRGISDYERVTYNGDEAEWQANCVALIGRIYRQGDACRPIPAETVEHFNSWRRAQHAVFVHQITSQPDRYGKVAPDDPLLAPPPEVKSAHYDLERKAWVLA